MARVVVVGGGFGGLASAARLAKLGHEVTLLEQADRLGGALSSEVHEDFGWDAGPGWTLLPAVVRDLFRKSGRPVERELDLVALDVVREHRFADGSRVAVPYGSRAAQVAAFDALGSGLGRPWVDHVASFTEEWEVLRRHYLEVPWRRDALPRDLARLLTSRQSLRRRLRRLPDERLRLVAAHPFLADGHDLRRVPAWLGVTAYVEQRFGAWTVAGGMAALATALTARLATRGVAVHTGTPASDLVLRTGRVVGVATPDGIVEADAVVCAIDPRHLPTLAPLVRRTTSTTPPTVMHLALRGDLPDLAHEVVLHGEPTLVVRTGGRAPAGSQAWTVHHRSADRSANPGADVLDVLADRGIDVRAQVVARIDRTPAELMARWGGSPNGVLWHGRSTVRHRLGPDTPIPGVYAAGAHATPGSGLPFVGLSAALVAQAIGPA